MDNEITASELEYLKIRLARETNYIEAAKLQKELMEKEAIYNEQFIKRLKEIENESYIIGNK